MRIDGNARVTWQEMLDAVCRHVTTAPVGALAEYDAMRLGEASSIILVRLAEMRDKANGK